MMMRNSGQKKTKKSPKSYIGKKINSWLLLKVLKPTKNNSMVLAQCKCGRITKVQWSNLINGRSPHCFRCKEIPDRYNTLGYSVDYPSEYNRWLQMIYRCKHPEKYKNIEGITVCKRWRESFINFLNDMGKRPPGKVLCRIYVGKGYYPSNCKWSTLIESSNKRRNNVIFTLNGITMTRKNWERKLGLGRNTIAQRLKKGWTIREALTIRKCKETKS